MPSDQCRPEFWLDNNFECIVPEEKDWLSERRIYPPAGDMVCYTDGSKRDGCTGAGFFCEFPLLEASTFTGTYATVLQVELFAISELCTTETLANASGKDIYICTDSQTAIVAIRSLIVDSRAVRECKIALNAIGDENKVTIIWVPGHEDILGNERADLLAGNGTGGRFIGP